MNHRNSIFQTIKKVSGAAILLLFLFGYTVKYGHDYGLILPHKAESAKHICHHPEHQHASGDEDSSSNCLICAFDLIAVSPSFNDFSIEELPLFGKSIPGYKIVLYTPQPLRELSGRGPPQLIV